MFIVKCNMQVFSLKTTYFYTKFKLLQVFEQHMRFILKLLHRCIFTWKYSYL